MLLWSALSTLEAPLARTAPTPSSLTAGAPAPGLQGVVAEEGADVPAGSVADHHLDDLPLQAHSEVPADVPGLPPVHGPGAPLQGSEMPQARLSPATATPCLAGPLRPPCRAFSTA